MIHKIFAQILTLSLLLILSNAGCSFSPQSSLELDVLHDGTLIDGTASQRITFLLLNEDPIYLGMNLDDENGLLSSTYPRLKVLAGKLNARRFGGYSLGPDVFLLLDQSRPLWEPHVIRSMQTNLDGHSQVDGLKPGKYWLMAYRQTKTNEAFWLQAVMINVTLPKLYWSAAMHFTQSQNLRISEFRNHASIIALSSVKHNNSLGQRPYKSHF